MPPATSCISGIAEVLEAMDIGFAADVWGDIPYAEAVGANTTPAFEPQMQVYTDLLTLLDKAIADMGAGGTGPAGHDLIYNGSAAKWIEAAHTLKARIYLHQVRSWGTRSIPARWPRRRRASALRRTTGKRRIRRRRRSATCGRNSRTRRSVSISSPARRWSTS